MQWTLHVIAAIAPTSPVPLSLFLEPFFLLEHGAALKAVDLATLDYRIRYLMAHPEKLADMAARARALGRPQAARHVVETVLVQAARQRDAAHV